MMGNVFMVTSVEAWIEWSCKQMWACWFSLACTDPVKNTAGILHAFI